MKETSGAKKSSPVRSSRFSHMEDSSALVPIPDRCLCEAGLFLIVLHFLCQVMAHKPCPGVWAWMEVTPLVAFLSCISHFVFPKQARSEQFPNGIPSSGLSRCAAWQGVGGQGWVWLAVGREDLAPGGWVPGLVWVPSGGHGQVGLRRQYGAGASSDNSSGRETTPVAQVTWKAMAELPPTPVHTGIAG